jgi:hypothetical protein
LHARSANKCVKISQGLPIDVHNHLLYAQYRIQISQGLLIKVPNHLLYFLHVHTNSKGLLIDVPLSFYYFQCTHRRVQKVRGSRSTLHTTSITFSTCIATYKNQDAPQLSRYYHQWFGLTLNPMSASPSIHRNAGEQMSARSSFIMIGHVGYDRLISFIG